MKKIIITVQKVVFIILTTSKKIIFSSKKGPFIEESYKSLLPLLSNTSSYLQTFLGAFASSLMTVDSAFIVVIISRENFKMSPHLYFGLTVFIVAMMLYMFAFGGILVLRSRLLKRARQGAIDMCDAIRESENKISDYIYLMVASTAAFFVSFLHLLSCLKV